MKISKETNFKVIQELMIGIIIKRLQYILYTINYFNCDLIV
jgi:hypothetical protein